jgi:hypothetical protein
MTGAFSRFHTVHETFGEARHQNSRGNGVNIRSPSAHEEENVSALLQRIRSEFLEMPGLRLTPAQAARLWAVDRQTSERILDGLAMAGFLFRTRNGAYLRATAT